MEYDRDEILEETYKLARDNNKMLRRMRRAAWLGGIFKVLFWAVIIGVPAWLYYEYAQPIIGDLMQTISQVQGASAQIQQMGGSMQQIQQLDQGATGQLLDLLNSIPGVQMPN